MALGTTTKQLRQLLSGIQDDLDKATGGNKAASQRVRTGTVALEKVAKLYRKESIVAERRAKVRSTTTKRRTATSAKKRPTARKKATTSPRARASAKTRSNVRAKAKTSRPTKATKTSKARTGTRAMTVKRRTAAKRRSAPASGRYSRVRA